MSRRKSWGRLKSLKISSAAGGFAQVEAEFSIKKKIYKGVYSRGTYSGSNRYYACYQKGEKFNNQETWLWSKIEPYILRFLRDATPIDLKFDLRGSVKTSPTRTPAKANSDGQYGWEM